MGHQTELNLEAYTAEWTKKLQYWKTWSVQNKFNNICVLEFVGHDKGIFVKTPLEFRTGRVFAGSPLYNRWATNEMLQVTLNKLAYGHKK